MDNALPDADVPSGSHASEVPSLPRQLLSGGIWALAGKIVNVASTVAVSALLTRLLQPTQVGTYFLALSVVTAGAMLARLGLEKTVLQLLAQSRGQGRLGRARAVVRKVFVIAAINVTLTAAMLGSIGGHWLATRLFSSATLASIALFTAPWMAVVAFEVLFAETFRGFHDIPKASVLGRPVARVITVGVLLALLLVRGQTQISIVVLITVAAGALSLALATWFLWKIIARLPKLTTDTVSTAFILRNTWPLLISNLTLFVIGQADIWIIGTFRPESEVAIYGATVRLVLLVGMSLTIVNAVLPPLIGELYAKRQLRRLQHVIRMTASVAAFPSVIVLSSFIFAGGLVLEATYGTYYRTGAAILAVLSVAQLVNVWVGSCGYMLIMSGHQRELMWSAILSGSVGVLGGLATVNRLGALGVASAVATGIILQQILMLFLARWRCGLWTHASVGLLVHGMAGLLTRSRAVSVKTAVEADGGEED